MCHVAPPISPNSRSELTILPPNLTSLLPVRRIPTREIGAFVQTIFHKTDYLHMPHGVFSCHTRNDDLFATFPIAQLFISFSIPLRRFLLEKEGKTVAWWRRFFSRETGKNSYQHYEDTTNTTRRMMQTSKINSCFPNCFVDFFAN